MVAEGQVRGVQQVLKQHLGRDMGSSLCNSWWLIHMAMAYAASAKFGCVGPVGSSKGQVVVPAAGGQHAHMSCFSGECCSDVVPGANRAGRRA